jgi:GMP synthase (glutamine-hydrolysing)
VKPFLLLATRAEDAVADAEYQAFLSFGGLADGDLLRIRLESAPLDELLPGLDLSDYSGVLVGGSPFTSSDPVAEKSAVQVRVERDLARLIGEVIKFDVPFLGACYGIGTLGLYLGGVLDGTYGEPVSAVQVTLTADGVADPLLDGVPAQFLAYVGHKEALRALPPGDGARTGGDVVLLAGSAGCPVQMFRLGQHQYATQFHPELDLPGIVQRMQVYRDAGYFRPGELTGLIEQVSSVVVTWPTRILANFTARYARG